MSGGAFVVGESLGASLTTELDSVDVTDETGGVLGTTICV